MQDMEDWEAIPFGPDNGKYWAQRYDLFEKYDEGIRMDKGESFVSGLTIRGLVQCDA